MGNKRPAFAYITMFFLIAILLSCGDGREDPGSLPLAPDGSEPIAIHTLVFNDSNLQSCVNEKGAFWVHEVTELYCGYRGIADLVGIASLTCLETLDLSNNDIDASADLINLSTLLTLKSLTLSWNSSGSGPITDVSALSPLVNLTYLDLSGQSLADAQLSDLNTLVNLQSLNLSGNSLSDGSFVAGVLPSFPNLTSFDVSYSGISTNGDILLTTLTSITGLTSLGIAECSISNASVNTINSLKNLTFLEIGGNNPGLTYGALLVAELSSLPKLIHLGLDGSGITDFTSFALLTELTSLGLSWNAISDFTLISSLTNLTSLNLSGTDASGDLSTTLAPLTQLRSLWLTDNSISNIAYLSSMSGLTELYLDNNDIVDVSPLSGLTGLNQLGLYWNSITSDVSVLSGMNQLWHLDLQENNLIKCSELSALSNSIGGALNSPLGCIGDAEGLVSIVGVSDGNLNTCIGNIGRTYQQEIVDLTCQSASVATLGGLDSFTHLARLDVSSNSITDISSLSLISTLEEFNISSNTVDISSDVLSTVMSAQTGLKKLYLGGNNFTNSDTLKTALSAVTTLDVLYLDYTTPALSDVGALGSLTNLNELNLESSGVTTGVSNLQNLTKAYWINLDTNASLSCSEVIALQNALGSSVVSYTSCI